MSRSLPWEEIKKRLIRLRNLEALHESQRLKIWHLRQDNRMLKHKVKALEVTVSTQQKTIEDFKLQIEELRVMVFGKKKEKSFDDDDFTPPKEKVERTKDSYRRRIPKDEEVTETKPYPIDRCQHCHGMLSKKKTTIFFEEDIPIPATKIVRKNEVEKGYCSVCKKWSTAIPLPSSTVILGNNIQKYICYLNVMCRLSYSQVNELLRDTYRIEVSQGEIAKILSREGTRHRPEYEQLKVRIRGEPAVGLDETSYAILSQGERAFAWIMTALGSGESIFLLGQNRGGGHTIDLQGENYTGFTVTDDFPGYKKLSNHQLCWAHLVRKFRDLARSKELPEQHTYYALQYKVVAELFSDIKKHRNESLRDSYTKRLEQLAIITSKDCLKLIRIKTTLSKNIPKYLTCLGNPLIPLTNNQSERSLRHLVLKRKISFGSWTKKGADTLAILLSVLMSRKQRNPMGYFGEWVRV
jgi:hypothetical protein